jgi:putative ABC transport system ATP-binding protein
MSLSITALIKTFSTGSASLRRVVDIGELELPAGTQAALRGPSGCGKTTLLHLVSGLMLPDSGSIRLSGVDICRLGESERDLIRADGIGLVFQGSNLIQSCSVRENIELGAAFSTRRKAGRVEEVMERLSLTELRDHLPRQLSQGQQQRVAVARAIVKRPMLVLADEPTASADDDQAAATLELLKESCRELGSILLFATHDARALRCFERVIHWDSLAASPSTQDASC